MDFVPFLLESALMIHHLSLQLDDSSINDMSRNTVSLLFPYSASLPMWILLSAPCPSILCCAAFSVLLWIHASGCLHESP